MVAKTVWRVVSDSEGHITEYDSHSNAHDRVGQLNQETGLPNDHKAVQHTYQY